MKKLVVLFLTLVMAVSGTLVSVSGKSGRTEKQEKEIVDISKLKYESYDFEAMALKVESTKELTKDKKNMKDVGEALSFILKEYLKLMDMTTIADLEYLEDPGAQEKDEHKTEAYLNLEKARGLIVDLVKDIVSSECDEAVFSYSAYEGFLEDVSELESMTEEQRELIAARRAVMDEWDNADIELDTKDAEVKVCEYLLRIAQLDNELAKTLGDKNSLDRYYKIDRKNKYSSKDIFLISTGFAQQKYFQQRIFGNVYTEAYSTSRMRELEEKFDGDIVELLGQFTEKMAPELKESYDNMMAANGLIISRSGLPVTGTYFLMQYGIPVIRVTEKENRIETLKTLLYEFGHYLGMYWNKEKESPEIDEAYKETFASGMELLATKFYSGFMGEGAETEVKRTLGHVMDKLVTACAAAMTEYRAYSGNYTKANKFYEKVGNLYFDYNYTCMYGKDLSWLETSEFFSYPGRASKDIISILAVLELYDLAQKDYQAAVDKYVELLGLTDMQFEEALKKVGLTSVWTYKTARKFIKEFTGKYYEEQDAPVISGVEEGSGYDGIINLIVTDESNLDITADCGRYDKIVLAPVSEMGGASSEYFGVNKFTLTAYDTFANESEVSFILDQDPFIANVSENGDGGHVIAWEKVANAGWYVVYGAPADGKYSKLKTTGGEETVFVHEGADGGAWKYYIEAYAGDQDNPVLLDKSFETSFACPENEKYTNIESLKIDNGEGITIKKGSKKTLKVSYVSQDASKTVFTNKQIKSIRYISSNTDVAKVNSKGTVTAKRKGTCYIYCLTANGLMDRIKIKVS